MERAGSISKPGEASLKWASHDVLIPPQPGIELKLPLLFLNMVALDRELRSKFARKKIKIGVAAVKLW